MTNISESLVFLNFFKMQSITHRSEEPEYHMSYLIPSDTPVTEKLYIIDDGDHSTMLLASEY